MASAGEMRLWALFAQLGQVRWRIAIVTEDVRFLKMWGELSSPQIE